MKIKVKIKRHKKKIVLFLAALIVYVSATCCIPASPGNSQKGTAILVPGMTGQPWLLGGVERALRDSGYEGCFIRHTWGKPFMIFTNLREKNHKNEQAELLAERIEKIYKENPSRPIDLVGYSAGGGLIVKAIESLPEDIRVRNVTLVHSAVAPEHDLTAALSHIDGKLKNVCSDADWLFLGLGTSSFGTVDDVNTRAAGMIGFDLDAAVPDEQMRVKVKQVPWDMGQLLTTGRWGGHALIYGYKFNKNYVANKI